MTAPLRVLVLEDWPDRFWAIHSATAMSGSELDLICTATAQAAVDALHRGGWDVVCLDYDLDQDGKLDAAVTGHGGRVASWLARSQGLLCSRHPAGCLPLVIIHSKNGPGAASMLVTLMPAGYQVMWVPAPLGAGVDQQFDLIGSIIASRRDAPHATR